MGASVMRHSRTSMRVTLAISVSLLLSCASADFVKVVSMTDLLVDAAKWRGDVVAVRGYMGPGGWSPVPPRVFLSRDHAEMGDDASALAVRAAISPQELLERCGSHPVMIWGMVLRDGPSLFDRRGPNHAIYAERIMRLSKPLGDCWSDEVRVERRITSP